MQENIFKKRYVQHLLFWLGYLLLETYFEFAWTSEVYKSMHPANRFFMCMTGEFSAVTLKIPQVYLTFYILKEFIQGKRNLLTGWILLIGQFALFTVLHRAQIRFVCLPYIYHDFSQIDLQFSFNRIASAVIDLVFVNTLALFFKQWRNQKRSMEREKQLMKEKLETELHYLKAQINPHFLFNTLNNIYALARKESKETPLTILKLSELLRFMLYESEKKLIPISQEISLIEHYIDLQRIRYNERLQLDFSFYIENNDQPITPLLLMPVIENAFKYGVSETQFDAKIELDLQLENGQLFFRGSNTKSQQKLKNEDRIGLNSLRRQLQLLYKEYHIDIEDSETQFTIEITINLLSYADL